MNIPMSLRLAAMPAALLLLAGCTSGGPTRAEKLAAYQAYAGAPVLTAMGMDGAAVVARREAWDPARGQPLPGVPGGETLQAFGSGTYSIQSRARLRGGRVATLDAVVRTGGSALPGMAYTPLRWEEGMPSP